MDGSYRFTSFDSSQPYKFQDSQNLFSSSRFQERSFLPWRDQSQSLSQSSELQKLRQEVQKYRLNQEALRNQYRILESQYFSSKKIYQSQIENLQNQLEDIKNMVRRKISPQIVNKDIVNLESKLNNFQIQDKQFSQLHKKFQQNEARFEQLESKLSQFSGQKQIQIETPEQQVKALMNQASRPLSSQYEFFSIDRISQKERDRNSLFSRLYQDAQKKREAMEIAKRSIPDKELENCTFHPRILNSSHSFTQGSVFDRLNISTRNQRDQIYKQERLQREIEGCTFHPKTNIEIQNIKEPFDKLYRDAEAYRRKIRSRELEEKEKELVQCTFKPRVSSKARSKSPLNAHQRLYTGFKEREKEKRQKQLQAQIEYDKPFTPSILPDKRKQRDNTPVYQRMQNDIQRRFNQQNQRKLIQEMETSKRNLSVSRQEGNQRCEHLYQMHKEMQEKKIRLQEKLMKEAGINFKPDLSKSIYTPTKRTPK